jgi:hypothetical protein
MIICAGVGADTLPSALNEKKYKKWGFLFFVGIAAIWLML